MEEGGALQVMSWGAHFVSVAATMVLFGASLFPFYAGVRGWPPIWSRLAPPVLALILLVALALSACLTLLDFTGDAASLVSPDELQAFFLQTNFGPVWLAGIAASLALLAVSLGFAAPTDTHGRRDAALLILSGGVLVSFAAVGHAGGTPNGGAAGAVASEIMHLMAAAAWLGGLPPLLAYLAGLQQKDHNLPSALPVLNGFSFMGQWAVAILIIGGVSALAVLIAARHVNLSSLQAGPYVLTLSIKFVLLVIMLAIAGINRFVLIPAMERGSGDAGRLYKLVYAEALLGALVVGAATILSHLPPPN